MNYQTARTIPIDALTEDGDPLRATLQRLQAVLDPANAALDLGRARDMVGSLIDLTRRNEQMPIFEPADLYRSGRKHLILKALLRKAGSVCTKDELAELCRASTNSTRVIKVYVCQIRAQLADEGLADVIETVWGIGYRISIRDAREIRRLIRQQTSSPPAQSRAVPCESSWIDRTGGIKSYWNSLKHEGDHAA